jgi:hypothetical protein
MKVFIFIANICICSSLFAISSPNPQDVVPSQHEFTVSLPQGAIRGFYQKLKLGALLYQSGSSLVEEKDPGKVREWVFQAQEGSIGIGLGQYTVTCVRVSRFNTLVTSQPFYYEIRISALEGSCTEDPEKRRVELLYQMDDFILNQYRSGSLKFFGQNIELLTYPIILKAPENISATVNDGGYFVTGKLNSIPNVADLKVELMARPKGQVTCNKKGFDPDKDPYSSYYANVSSLGQWGVTVPKLGGAICTRLVGGNTKSLVVNVVLPP